MKLDDKQVGSKVFGGTELDTDKVQLVRIPKEVGCRSSVQQYFAKVRQENQERLDEYACVALLNHPDVIAEKMRAIGGLKDLTRLIFDGTIWRLGRDFDFPAIAYISCQFHTDIYPLQYFDDPSLMRVVIVP